MPRCISRPASVVRVNRTTFWIPGKAYAKSAETLIDYKGSKLRPEKTSKHFRLESPPSATMLCVFRSESTCFLLSGLPSFGCPKQPIQRRMLTSPCRVRNFAGYFRGCVVETLEFRGPLQDPEDKKLDTCRRLAATAFMAQVQRPGVFAARSFRNLLAHGQTPDWQGGSRNLEGIQFAAERGPRERERESALSPDNGGQCACACRGERCLPFVCVEEQRERASWGLPLSLCASFASRLGSLSLCSSFALLSCSEAEHVRFGWRFLCREQIFNGGGGRTTLVVVLSGLCSSRRCRRSERKVADSDVRLGFF